MAFNKKNIINKATTMQQKKIDKKRTGRDKKRKEKLLKTKEGRITNAKKNRAVKKANKILEVRRLELLGIAMIFKIVKGREIIKLDKFKPEDIKYLCESFLRKYRRMGAGDRKTYKPLVPLAEKKIKQAQEYFKKGKEINGIEKKRKLIKVVLFIVAVAIIIITAISYIKINNYSNNILDNIRVSYLSVL
jgi:hypothetical protein